MIPKLYKKLQKEESECCCAMKKVASDILSLEDKINSISDILDIDDKNEFHKITDFASKTGIDIDIQPYLDKDKEQLAFAFTDFIVNRDKAIDMAILLHKITQCCPYEAQKCSESNKELKRILETQIKENYNEQYI